MTTTVLFTDLAAPMPSILERGEAGVTSLATYRRRAREVVEHAGGRVTKATGDGILALFGSAHQALAAAEALQQQAHEFVEPLMRRSGVHVGEIVDHDDADLNSEIVVVARRLSERAAPGTVVVSDLVRQLVGRRGSHRFTDCETDVLNGLTEPTTFWRLAWEPARASSGCTVVVADDVALIRAGVCRLLSEAGFEVVGEADDFDTLLDIARRTEPALVVTDIRMPPTQTDEGLRAASMLRSERPDLAIVVLSQHVEPSAAALLLTHAPTSVGYILKERVGDLDEFVSSCRTVADGGCVIDPSVTARLTTTPAGAVVSRLTGAERRVLDLMAQGRSNLAIARDVICSVKTVESHVRSIFTKLDLIEDPDENRRVAAVVAWLQAQQRG